jgi:hypothetical protein
MFPPAGSGAPAIAFFGAPTIRLFLVVGDGGGKDSRNGDGIRFSVGGDVVWRRSVALMT